MWGETEIEGERALDGRVKSDERDEVVRYLESVCLFYVKESCKGMIAKNVVRRRLTRENSQFFVKNQTRG